MEKMEKERNKNVLDDVSIINARTLNRARLFFHLIRFINWSMCVFLSDLKNISSDNIKLLLLLITNTIAAAAAYICHS
jgi:hypothetical protein